MTQTRRQFVTTAVALAVSPALPAMAAIEAWPPEILELEQVANQIHGQAAAQSLVSLMHGTPAEHTTDYGRACLMRGIKMYDLRRFTPEHEPARAALARFLEDGTLPMSPRPVLPFMTDT